MAEPMRFTMAVGSGLMRAWLSSKRLGQGKNTLAAAPNIPPSATTIRVVGRSLGPGLATQCRIQTFEDIVVQMRVGGQAMASPRPEFTV